MSKRFHDLLPDNQDNFKMKVTACAADGSKIRTFGRTYMEIGIAGKEFVLTPMIADISDDGILGLDFAALYGVVLDPVKGSLRIEEPYGLVTKCVLRQVSAVASLVETRKIPPGMACDVMFRADSVLRNKEGVMEPDMVLLSSFGLESADVIVSNSAWAVLPITNPGSKTVYLQKGTIIGNVILAEAVTSSPIRKDGLGDPGGVISEELEKLVSGSSISDRE